MILLLLAGIVADFFSIAILLLGYYLWRQWHLYHHTAANYYAQHCLYGLIAVAAFALFGKFLIVLLFSKTRKGEVEPQFFRPRKSEKLKRPDGSIINIEHYGKEGGQPIVFVHGWNSNIQGWFYQKRYFENNYHLVMIDLPGLGKSTRPANKDFSLLKMSHDLHAVINHTGIKNPFLWGHSIGGMVILTLLAKNREMESVIKGVILEHTTYTNPVKTIIFSKVLTAIQKPVLQPICWLLIFFSPIVWISRWMSYLNGNSQIMTRLLTFAGTQTPKQLNFVTLLSTLAPPAVTARGVLGMFKYDVTKALPLIRTPALIIAANKDRLTKPVASTYMKNHLANAKLVTVFPSNHQGLVERHEEVNKAAEKYIQQIKSL